MNLVMMPILAILVGLFVRSRLLGTVLYLSIQAIVFTFQTLMVLLIWMAGIGGPFGGTGAFGIAPTEFPIPFSQPDIWMYGLLNVAVMLFGVALTVGIINLRARRRARTESMLTTQPAL